MGLPHRPEPVQALRARYAQALEPAYDATNADKILAGKRPGLERRHVFDEGDIRLIISRDDQGDGVILLHVSASTHGELSERIARGMINFNQFDLLVRALFRNISGDHRPLRFSEISKGKGVPHYWLPDPLTEGVQ